jgi:hypothetical protein
MKIACRRRDRVDADDLAATVESPGYALIDAKQAQMIAAAEKKLRTCAKDELEVLQAEIRVIETMRALPRTMTQEILARLRKQEAAE